MRLDVEAKLARRKLGDLHRSLASLKAAVVAYSGGVDSSFLAFMAHQALGGSSLAVTADSPSLARSELRAAIDFANEFGLRHRVVQTLELSNERYSMNDADRCFFCKDSLMDSIEAITQAVGSAEILVGVNVDDLGDHRPGQHAVEKRGGRWPLVEVGLSKIEIRWLSKELGLPTWDKPAAACLASRIAYGVPVTREALHRIEVAEECLKRLGLSGQIRVRDQGRELARIETSPLNLEPLLSHRETVVRELKRAGFLFVTLDLEGYRQGSHNEALKGVSISFRGGTSVAEDADDPESLSESSRGSGEAVVREGALPTRKMPTGEEVF